MKKTILLITAVSILALFGCTTLKVVDPDPNTGYFPAAKKATVVKSEKINLDERKGLLLVGRSDFTGRMAENIGYFEEVIDVEDLEKIIIQEDLTEEVPSLREKIGLNKAAKAYKPFLWLRWNYRVEGNRKYEQLILTDPLTLEDYFIAETYMDYMWAGVNDQNNNYPAFNALIDYIAENSETFRNK